MSSVAIDGGPDCSGVKCSWHSGVYGVQALRRLSVNRNGPDVGFLARSGLRVLNGLLCLGFLLLDLLHLLFEPLFRSRVRARVVESHAPVLAAAHRPRLGRRHADDRARRRQAAVERRRQDAALGVLERALRARAPRAESALCGEVRLARRVRERTPRPCTRGAETTLDGGVLGLCCGRGRGAWGGLLCCWITRVSIGQAERDMDSTLRVEHGGTNVRLYAVLVFAGLPLVAGLITEHDAAFRGGDGRRV